MMFWPDAIGKRKDDKGFENPPGKPPRGVLVI
jgi:hypothetical protein